LGLPSGKPVQARKAERRGLAIFHLSVHDRVSRGAGQSSLASAAYIDRERYVDERTGEIYDFTRLRAPLFTGVYLPKDAPEWGREASSLWNHAEAFEARRDAQLAMLIDIALPHELTFEQNRYLLQDFVRENFVRKGYAAHVAIHPPDHDHRNIHAHVLVTLRKIDAQGFAPTKAEQQENYRNRDAYVEGLRESWEKLANRHLERWGHDERIDRRTLKEQGVDREPTTHLGPTAAAAVHDRADRRELAAVEAELKAVEAEIIDLAAARAERQAREAAAEASKEEARAAGQGAQGTTRELGKTAGDIRLAWSLTHSGPEFGAALKERGPTLARVSAEEARRSERVQAFAKEIGRYARRFAEGELVVVNEFGDAYRIDQRTTGASRDEIDKRLATIDATALPTMTDARIAMRDASRAEWIAGKERERPLTVMEERVAAAALAAQEVAADMLRRFGRAMTGEEFAAGLAQAGVRLARVTAEDERRIDLDRAVAFAVGDAQFVPWVRPDEIVAIDRGGGLHRLSPHRIDLAGFEESLGGNLPSVAEAQSAAAAPTKERDQGQKHGDGFEQQAAPMGPGGADSGMAEPGSVVGRFADGALRLLGGVFEFFFPTKREPPPKLDPEEEYRRWLRAEETRQAREELLRRAPSLDRDERDPEGPDIIEESETWIDGQTRHVRLARGRRRSR
jgi:hypothetical protein